jgi:peroxiredoxin
LVNFFATWCQICQKEMRPLGQMYQEWHSRGLDIVMVSNEDERHVRTFAESHKVPFPVIAGGQEIMNQVRGLNAFPTAVLLDKEGRARHLIVGADLSKIRDAIAALMAEPSPVEQATKVTPQGEPGTVVSLFPLSFSASDIGGRNVSTGAQRGRVLLLNVFATWCPPCQQETPELIKMYQEHQAAGLDVVMVSSEAESVVRGFAESYRIPFPVIAKGRSIIEQLKGARKVVPISVLVDRQGRVREVIEGADVTRIREGVTKLLAEPVPPTAETTPAVTPAPAKP